MVGGALPPGIALRTDTKAFFGTDQPALIGVAATPGDYPVQFSATNATGTVPFDVTITITALNVQDIDLPDGFAGVAYSHALTPLPAGTTPTFAQGDPWPAGPAMNSAGVISWNSPQPGSYYLPYILTNNGVTVYRGLTLNVYALGISTPAQLPNVTQGDYYSQTLVSSPPGASFMLNGCWLPSGLTLDPSGTISGTINGGPGQYYFCVMVTDSNHAAYTKYMALDVVGTNASRMSVNSWPLNDAVVGNGYRAQFDVSLGGVAPFTWSASGLPPGMAIRYGDGTPGSHLSPGRVEIIGRPQAAGNYQDLQLVVTDATGDSLTVRVPLHVSVLDKFSQLPSGVISTAYTGDLVVVGGSQPYAVTLAPNSSPLPAGLNLVSGQVTGTPLENGGFSPTFLFTDSANPSQTLTTGDYFSISGGTDANLQTNWLCNGTDLGYAVLGSTYQHQLSACGSASTYTWSVGSGLPSGITLDTNGLLHGTATPAGTYTFIATADGGSGSYPAVRQLTLVITPIIITTNSLPYGNVSSAYTPSLSATGGTGPLTWSANPLTSLPPGVTLNPNGTFSGRPTATGRYSFKVLVSDGHNSASSYFLIDIYAAGSAPPVSIGNGANLGTWHFGTIQQLGLQASGGNGTYSWTRIDGALPPGLALRTDLPSWISSGSQAGLIGVATTPGTYHFTLQVESGGQKATRAFTLKVNKLGLVDYTLPPAFATREFRHRLVANGNTGNVTFSATTNNPLPSWLTLSSDGVLSSTHPVAGSYSILITYADGTDSSSAWLGLNVFAVNITTPATLPAATLDAPYPGVTLAAEGGSGSYTFSTNGLPNGLNLSSATGAISGTATGIGPGPWGFSVTATDSNQVSFTKQMMIDIMAVPPTLLSIGQTKLDDPVVGNTYNAWIGVCCGGTAPFTWSAENLPDGLTLRQSDTSTNMWTTLGGAEITGISSISGDRRVKVTVQDALGATSIAIIPIHVSTLDAHMDVLSSNTGGRWSGTLKQTFHARFRVLGGTGPYSGSLIQGNLPAGLTFDPNTLEVTGVPVENINSGFTLTFTDHAGETLTRTFGISIAGGGDNTLAINGGSGLTNGSSLGTTPVGQNYWASFWACCSPNSLTWSLESAPTTLPPGLALSGEGTLSGTPTATGTFVFLLRVSDSSGTNSAFRQFTLIVTPLNITTWSLPYANVGTGYSQTLTATGATTGLTWSLLYGSQLPPDLNLDPSTGVISGTPSSAGHYWFTVKTADTSGNIAIRQLSIDIYAPGNKPPLNLTVGPDLGTYQLGPATVPLTATGGSGSYHYSYAPGAKPIPGMRVQDGPPLPDFGSNATAYLLGVLTAPDRYTTSIRVTDAVSGGTFDKTLTLTVPTITVLNTWNLPHAIKGVPYSFSFAMYSAPGAYNMSATGLPPGIKIWPSGHVDGTPTSAGTYNFSIDIVDLTGGAPARGIGQRLVVDPFAITDNGILPSGVAGGNYSYKFNAPDCGTNCQWGSLGGLPASLSLTSDGTMTGLSMPIGEFTFTVMVTGSNGSVQKKFKLTVPPDTIQGLSITGDIRATPTFGTPGWFALSAAGGTPPYTWTVDSGTLPGGISLRGPGDTLSAETAPGTYYLFGRFVQLGTFNFTIKVTDSANKTATRDYVWTVSPMTLQNGNLPAGGSPLILGTPYSQKLLVMGGSGNYTSWTTPNGQQVFPGLMLDSKTGTVSGNPVNTGSSGSNIHVVDDQGNILDSYVSVYVASNASTTVEVWGGPSTGQTIFLGANANYGISATGGKAPYTITADLPLPDGVVLVPAGSGSSNTSPTLIISPMTPGTYTFTLRATDSNGVAGLRTYSIETPAFSGPRSTALPDGSVGVWYSARLMAYDVFGAPQWAGSALPPGLSLSTTGYLTGQPTTPGSYQFTATLYEAGSTSTFTFNVNISGLAITTTPVWPTAVAGVTYTAPNPLVTMTATGGGGAPLIWSASGLPAGLTMSAAGVITGMLPLGPDIWGPVITVSSGTSSITSTFTLYVRAANLTPPYLAYPTSLDDAVQGSAFSQGLLAQGGVPPYTWTLAANSALPPGLSLLSGNQLPPEAYPGDIYLAGQLTTAGQYSFALTVTDAAGASFTHTFSLNVSSINLPEGLPKATVGVFYSRQLVATGGTGPYTYTLLPVNLVQDPHAPGMTLDASGLLSGTPTSTGGYQFRVQVQDSKGHSYTKRYTLQINNSKGLMVSSSGGAGAVGMSINGLKLTTAGVKSTFTWTLVSGTLPEGVYLQSNGALAGWATSPGIYQFTVRATDTKDPSDYAERMLTLEISPIQIVAPAPANFAPASLPAGTVGTPYAFTFKAVGGEPPYEFVESPFNPLPPGLELSKTGLLSGTPGEPGVFNLRPVITDSKGTRMVSLTPTLTIMPKGVVQPLNPRSSWSIEDASAGVEYAAPLDRILEGGTPPYTWTVANGSSVPEGLNLVAGSNGVPNYLAGVPTTARTYTFALLAADSGGQTVTVPFTLIVSSLSLMPGAVPLAVTGSPYSLTLVPAGGVGPYTIALDPNSSAVPGLTFSDGVVSGSPAFAGVYPVQLNIADSAGNKLVRRYDFIVDNPAGEVPGISLSSNPVSIRYQQGDPAPPAVSLAVSGKDLSFTGLIAGIDGLTLSPADGKTTATLGVKLTLPTQLAYGTYNGFVAVHSPDAVNHDVITPVEVTIAPPCAYALSPSDALIPIAGGAGSFSIVTAPTCAWAVTLSDTSLITLTSPETGIGPATIRYTIPENTTGSPRDGSITVAGQTHSFTQAAAAACSFAISPAAFTATSAGGLAQVSIIASGTSCAWPASSGLDVSPSSGSGSAQVNVTIPPNLDTATVIRSATIAGRRLTVTQTGLNCQMSLDSASSATIPAVGGIGSVGLMINEACNYTTIPGPSWISIISGLSGRGPGTLSYTVDPNSTTVTRTGSITIGGTQYQVQQLGVACSFTLDTSTLGSPFDTAGGNGSIKVNANGSNCSWSASSNSAWAHVVNTGAGSVIVRVDSNAAATATRIGSVTVAGQTVNLSQSGTQCTYALRSDSATIPASGGSATVGVISPSACSWTASSNNPDWLPIASSGTGGTADVQFSPKPNTSPRRRTGTLTIAGQTFTVAQAGAACTYSLASSSITVADTGDTGTVTLSPLNGCDLAAAPVTSYANWITATQSAGVVTYVAAANLSGSARSGTILAGDQVFTINQLGGACMYSLAAYGAAFRRGGGSGSVVGSPSAAGCGPGPGTTMPSFIFLGVLTGPDSAFRYTEPYTIAPFTAATKAVRRGTITFGGQIFMVKQTSW